MFPNFKNLQDRERKRRALLRQNLTDLEIAKIKQDAYSMADWASDQENRLALTKTVGTTTVGVQTSAPSMSTIGTQSSPSTSTSGVQVSPSVMTSGTQATVPVVPTTESGMQTEDIGDEADSLSDIDELEMKAEVPLQTEGVRLKPYQQKLARTLELPEDQKLPRIVIIEMFTRHPELSKDRIGPIKVSGDLDKTVYIGEEGKLRTTAKGGLSRKPDRFYDWGATLAYIRALMDAKTQAATPQAPKALTSSGSDVEMDAFDTLKTIINKNSLPLKPIPFKKGVDRKGSPIPLNTSWHVNEDMKIIDRYNKEKERRQDISWSNTLNMFTKKLTEQKIKYKKPSTRLREVDIDSGVETKPRAMSSSMHLSDLEDSHAMSGLGIAGLKGRRAVLKHEFDKLTGEHGLGNDSRRVSRELKLLRKIF